MRVIIACVLLFLSAASGQRLLGRNRCTWGPSYWCQHAGTMKECNQASICGREWRSVEMQQDESKECNDCKMFANVIRNMQRAGKTQAEIRAYTILVCSHVQDSTLRGLCFATTNSYEHVLMHLVRQLPAAKVCAAFGLCLSSRSVPRIQVESEQNSGVNAINPSPLLVRGSPMQRMPASTEACDKCLKVMNDVKAAVESNKTREEIADTLRDICSVLGPLETRCNSAVDEILPQILNFIDSGIQPQQICQLIGLCSSSSSSRSSGSSSSRSSGRLLGSQGAMRSQRQLPLLMRKKMPSMLGTECELCEMLITEARQLLKSNKTEKEILDFIRLRVCGLLPAEKDKCITAVTEYGEVIMQLLATELDPASVCKALGACGNSLRRRSLISATPQCIACELVMREVDQLLGDNRTEPAIESALEKVCSVLPQTVRQECDQFVQQYTPVVVELLAKDLSPSLVCRTIGLCASMKARSRSSQPRRVDNQSPCEFCVTAVTYLKAYLVDESTDTKLTHFLDGACNFLSTSLHDKCTKLIDKAVPSLMKMISNDLIPKELCEEWRACDPPSLEMSVDASIEGSRTIGSTDRSSSSRSNSDTILMSQIN